MRRRVARLDNLLALKEYLTARLASVELEIAEEEKGTAADMARRWRITASAWHRLVRRHRSLAALGRWDEETKSTRWLPEEVDRWADEHGYKRRNQ